MAYSLEDLPADLKPISILVEASSTLRSVKESYRARLEKDKEIEQVIRDMKRGDTKIFTCSNTLELLSFKLKDSLSREDNLLERVEKLE